MTHFETIILILIYLFCYGYTFAAFVKEKDIGLRIFGAIAAFTLAFCAPIYIGGAIYEKLNKENS